MKYNCIFYFQCSERTSFINARSNVHGHIVSEKYANVTRFFSYSNVNVNDVNIFNEIERFSIYLQFNKYMYKIKILIFYFMKNYKNLIT
jgi:hypothetical protein